jgi:hypothetical protein
MQSAQASAPMRHTILCLMVAFLAAFLTPIICLLLMFIFTPVIFDSLAWAFIGPFVLSLLLTISIIVGFIAFLVTKAKLPDRGWRSLEAFNILLMFAATITASTVIAWPYFETPPEIGPQQAGLPTLQLAWTLKESGSRSASGPRLLAWSADGERLAAYVGKGGIITWSPDGKYQKEFPLHMSSSHVLGYLSGPRLLITGPVVDVNGAETRAKSQQMALSMAFSVIDAETGKVLQSIPGCHPGRPPGFNAASDLAVSPDERFVAVICGNLETQIDIYSPVDWRQVATLDLRAGDKRDPVGPRGLAFSPDGRMLAVGSRGGRITFFEVGSWTSSGSFVAYPDPPPIVPVLLSALAFSPDQAMIAAGSADGGSGWTYPPGIRLPGGGAFKEEFPADPLRVFRVSDGKRVATLGSFPGGLQPSKLTWSPSGEYLAFYDAVGAIRFWNPLQPNLSVVVARGGNQYFGGGNLLFSKDGSRLAANFPDGVRVFDVVPPH